MKALVKVEGESVGMFYQMTPEESKAEMNFRIINVITKRYGFVHITIEWI
jgi:hypothetical protein